MRLHRYTEVPHELALVVPDRSYASAGAPRMFNYATRDPRVLSWFPDELLRTTVTCPDEYVVRLRDPHIVHGHYIVLPPDRALAETFNFEPGILARPSVIDAAAMIRRNEVFHHPASGQPVFHIFKDVYYNYGHMLIEVLPKLLHILRMGVRRFTLLFPWSALAYLPMVEHTARVLGLSFDHVVCYNNQVLRVDEAFWIGPVAQHDRRKSQTLRELSRILAVAAPATGGPRKLYVTRPRTAGRPVVNQTELEDLARAHGYHVIEPSTLSFPDQVNLFHGADHVLGPMGAALSNTVFMRPGTRVSMIAGRRIDPFFWDIARLMNLRFDWVFTADAEAWTPEMQTEPLAIETARFAGLLSWLGE